MKLIIIRHGDPDYKNDCLTEKGILEAKALIPRMKLIGADEYYVSPLGRARQTAQIALSELNTEPEVLEFLREFPAKIERVRAPETGTHAWDWLPLDWANDPIFYDINTFYNHPVMKSGGVEDCYKNVISEFDKFLVCHGYRKKDNIFEVLDSNHKTICLFCHFGIECVFLSYLLNISPMMLWHSFVALPTSVTTVVTEEREKGIASFRVNGFGDVSHLYAEGIEPSFSARYRECFEDFK